MPKVRRERNFSQSPIAADVGAVMNYSAATQTRLPINSAGVQTKEATQLRRPSMQSKSNTENRNQRPGAQCHGYEGHIFAPVQVFHEGQVALRPFCSDAFEEI